MKKKVEAQQTPSGPGGWKHGLSYTRLYKIHEAMKRRCYNPNDAYFELYGGRGIGVCNEWLGENGVVNFYEWANANGYTDELSIDRIDSDGNYEPNNCRWSTNTEQQRNKRSNIFIEVNGFCYSIDDWSRVTGINKSTLYYRLKKGKPPDEILKID